MYSQRIKEPLTRGPPLFPLDKEEGSDTLSPLSWPVRQELSHFTALNKEFALLFQYPLVDEHRHAFGGYWYLLPL